MDKDKLIAVRKQLGTLEHNTNISLDKLGADIFEHNDLSSNSKYKKAYTDLTDIHKSINNKKKLIKEIEGKQARLKEIHEEEKQLENQIKYLEKEKAPHFEKAGSTAYASFKSSLLRGAEYEEVFSSLIELDDKIENIEDKIKEADEEGNESGFFKKIGSGLSKMVFKTRKNLSENSMEKLYMKAGKALFEKNLLKEIPVKEISLAAKPLFDNEESIQSMKSELGEFSAESGEIKSEIEAKTSGIKAGDKVGFIKGEVELLHQDFVTATRSLAGLVVSAKAGSVALSTESQQLVNEISERSSKIKVLTAEKETMEIHLKLDELKSDEHKKRFNIDVQQNKIKEAKQNIKAAEEDIQKIKQEIEELQEKL